MLSTLLPVILISATLPVAGGSDSCATPETIAGQGRFDFDLTLATTGTEGQAEPLCYAFGTSGITNDVWFEWTATTNGVARLYACDQTTADTKAAVHPGSGCPTPGQVLACNDDYCGLQSAVEWVVTGGSTYTIQIGNFPGAATGAGTFELFVGPLSTDNLALGGTATQSTNYTAATVGGLAIDGDTNGDWNVASCSCTDGTTANNWWEVDLGAAYPIGPILLYNRRFCCPIRLSNFRVSVFLGATEVWGEDAFVGSGNVVAAGIHRTVPPAATVGDRVRVQLLGLNNENSAYVTLAEVQVSRGEVGTVYCAGDGTGIICPCGNASVGGGGCANGTGLGGLLASVGSPGVSASTLTLQATQVNPGGAGIFFQGNNAINGGLGVLFGDGLRCAGGAAVRLQTVASDASGSASTTIDIASAAGLVAGDMKRYQFWYLDPLSPCGGGFNLTNGVEILWAP